MSILFNFLPLIKYSLSKIEFNSTFFSSISKNEFLLKGSDINKIDILFQKIEKNND